MELIKILIKRIFCKHEYDELNIMIPIKDNNNQVIGTVMETHKICKKCNKQILPRSFVVDFETYGLNP